MKKYRYVTVDTGKENDCWAKALMFALNKPYAVIREKLDWLVNKDGSIFNYITGGVLLSHGYINHEFTNIKVKDLLDILDLKKHAIVVSVESHTFFTYDGVIYDYIKNDDELYSELNEDVLHILYKPVSSYKDTKLAIEERLTEVNNLLKGKHDETV